MKTGIHSMALAALLMPGALFAGPYLGGSGVATERDYDEVETAAGWRAYLGYRGEVFPMFMEAAWVDTGDADVESFGGADDVELRFSGWQIGAGFFIPLSDTGSGLWTKASFYDGESEVDVPAGGIPGFPALSGEFERDTDGGSVAAGFTWKFTRGFGIRAEYEHLFDVEDFDRDRAVSLFMLGLIVELNIRRPRASQATNTGSYYPPPAPSAAPPQPYYAPYAVPQAEPQAAIPTPAPVAPATSASSAPALAPGPATAAATLSLRSRPTGGGTVDATLPAGTAVTLRQRRFNSDGIWWYVEHEAANGWAAEADLRQ